jgi:hypothetical protein
MFAMSFGNVLIYRAVGQEAKTALVTLRHHNIGTARVTPYKVRVQNAGPCGAAGGYLTTLQNVSQFAVPRGYLARIGQSPLPSAIDEYDANRLTECRYNR